MHNALVVEQYGLYRNIGFGIRHECKPGYHMVGRPVAVCRELENKNYDWDVEFTCYPGKTLANDRCRRYQLHLF